MNISFHGLRQWKARLMPGRFHGANKGLQWLSGISPAFPPLVFYPLLLMGAPARWPLWWFTPLVLTLAAWIVLAITGKRGIFTTAALFMGGLLLAGVMDLTGFRWLQMAYIPYVVFVGVFFSPLRLLLTTLSVPLLEAAHLAGGGPEEVFLPVSAALAAAFVSLARPKVKDGRGGEEEEEHPPGLPPDIRGLEAEQDAELRDILKAAILTLRADTISLFLPKDGKLSLRCSSSGQPSPSLRGIVHDVMDYRHPLVSGAPEAVPYAPGCIRPGKVLSVAASPVMEYGFIHGVMAVDSSRPEAFPPETVSTLEIFSGLVARALGRQRIHAETEKHLEWLKVIHEESSRLVTSLEPDTIMQMAGEAMEKIAAVSVNFFLKSGAGYELGYSNGLVDGRRKGFSLEGTLIDLALQNREGRYFPTLRGYTLPALPFDEEDVKSAFVLPLVYEDEPLGVIVFSSVEPDSLAPWQIDCLGVLGNQAAISLKNAIFHAEIKRRALTDGLTGLFNHKHFKEHLATELRRFTRSMRPFSLLLMDIDFFKKVNDTFGHQAGDEVLRGIAAVIGSTLRETDIPARYGGEEFVALLVDTGPAGAVRMAERLRHNIMDTRFEAEGKTINVTVSIGVSSCPTHGETEVLLIERADRALYKAKAEGRNRVICSES